MRSIEHYDTCIARSTESMVECPICDRPVKEININNHIDSGCTSHIDELPSPPQTQALGSKGKAPLKAGLFVNGTKRLAPSQEDDHASSPQAVASNPPLQDSAGYRSTESSGNFVNGGHHNNLKRSLNDLDKLSPDQSQGAPPKKRLKDSHAPLAERMRPKSLDDVAGQDLVGPDGILRNLIQNDRVPSMILWGGPGSGKTTIARLIAQTADTRFVEINSTSSGVAECKRLFTEASNERKLTGRKTIIFCDEIHRFSKSQQDVFLGPVEMGTVTLIGATTENPSFKVASALLSRCRTFTLSKLTDEHIFGLLRRAFDQEMGSAGQTVHIEQNVGPVELRPGTSLDLLVKGDHELLRYLAAFADGDARTGLNLLELAIDLCRRPGATMDDIKASLTKTLVYDRAGDQHYDTISAFHKSIRGSEADAALYYLARMLQSGEDPLYIARRMVVIASEDIGLADNTMLPLCIAAYTAAEKIGMPECRINLAHCAVALCQASKSVRAYRGLSAAYAALKEPGIAGLPIPVHLRNAPTRLMKELGYGNEYKYNPDFVNGKVKQDYLPESIRSRAFLPGKDFGEKIDPDLHEAHSEATSTGVDDEATSYYYDENGDIMLNPDGD